MTTTSNPFPLSQQHQHSKLANPPTLIEYKNLRFLIMDAPTETTLPLYIKEMKRQNVTDLVRVCDLTYSESLVKDNGINVHALAFADGDNPSQPIVNHWLEIVDHRFSSPSNTSSSSSTAGISNGTVVKSTNCSDKSSNASCLDQQSSSSANNSTEDDKPTIAVHCVAGLGRAPILVAIALIESGMNPLDTVEFLRKRRRGVLNNKQMRWLEEYRPRKKDRCIIC